MTIELPPTPPSLVRPADSRPAETRPSFEGLEARRLMAVHFAIDGAADVRAISRYVYGTNNALTGAYQRATLARLGGNRLTAYNWENNASNAGSDYQYQNDGYLGGGTTPGGATVPTLSSASARGAGAIVTIPMAGYVSADKNGDGDVRNSGPNYLQTRFEVMRPRKSGEFALVPDLTDETVYADEYVNWVKQTYVNATTDPERPVWFSLDNEPDLWRETHAEIHPAKATYAEVISKSIDYAGAIKDVMPNTKVFGPVSYGWNGFTTLQDAPDRNGRDFLDTYLAQLRTASTAAGRRLVDALDLHWYPEAQGGGTRIIGSETSAAVVAARLQAPRSLWDPTYTETSWITQFSTNGPINLLPRMRAKIATNNPGTDLAFTEYNYGGGGHISGGIAQADVLGIFGREGVLAANQWKLLTNESFVGGAFQMYRDYDGNGGRFGDTSIRATTDDASGSSVYASRDSANPNVLTIVAINKTANALPAQMSLSNLNVAAGAQANVYRLTSASSAPQAAGAVALDGAALTYSMPAYSVSTLRIALAPAIPAPQVQSGAFDFAAAPNAVSFTFDQDVGASLSAADLIVTNTATGLTATPTSVTFDAATRVARFVMPASIANGDYRATLAAGGVTNAGGTALASAGEVGFFVLRGDINRDRSVNFADLVILAQNYGQAGRTFAQGNIDGSADGRVEFSDLVILAQNYGQTLAAPLALPAEGRKSDLRGRTTAGR